MDLLEYALGSLLADTRNTFESLPIAGPQVIKRLVLTGDRLANFLADAGDGLDDGLDAFVAVVEVELELLLELLLVDLAGDAFRF